MTLGEIRLPPLEPWHGSPAHRLTELLRREETQILFPVWSALEAGLGSFLCVHGSILRFRLPLFGEGRGAMPGAGSTLLLRLDPTLHPSSPLALPQRLSCDGIPFSYSLFIGCGCILCPSHGYFSRSERVIEMKALDFKDLPARVLLLVLQFPLYLHKKSNLLICCLSARGTQAS